MSPESVRAAHNYVDERVNPIRNPQSAIGKSIAVGLMAAIAFTALALGTVEAWSIALFEIIVLFLLFLWGMKAVVDKRIAITFPAAALPLGAFVLLTLIQSISISGTGQTTESLSMDVEATRAALVVIFFLLVCFLIASNFFTTAPQLHSLANFLIVFGMVLSVFALIQHFTWEGRLFWFRPMQRAGAGTGGPFVNRNHFAGYMEMLIPIPVAFALSRAVRGEARVIYAFAAAIMGIAEVASLSRGGVVSLGAALLFIAAASARMKQRAAVRGSRKEDGGWRMEDGRSRIADRGSPDDVARSRSAIVDPRSSILNPRTSPLYPAAFVLLIVIAIGAGIFWVGADRGLTERLASEQVESGASGRPMIWRDTLSMIRAHPVLGVGVGAYQTVFPMYGHSEGSTTIEFAHNDYLQALADGGIVAGALALWFIIIIFRAFARGMKSQEHLTRALALGAGAGIFAILVHSLFDFNLQLPSNALLFLVLVAIVMTTGAKSEGQSERSEGRRGKLEGRSGCSAMQNN